MNSVYILVSDGWIWAPGFEWPRLLISRNDSPLSLCVLGGGGLEGEDINDLLDNSVFIHRNVLVSVKIR